MNDAAVIGTPTVFAVTEDGLTTAGNLTASGSISISDVDANEASFAVTVASVGSNLGSLALAAGGSYTYSVANSAVQYLGVGIVKTETFTVTAFDGTTKNVSFTITGVNDPLTALNASVAIVEDSVPAVTAGVLSAIEVDANQAGLVTFAATGPIVAGLNIASNGAYQFDSSNAAYQDLAAGQVRVVSGGFTASNGTETSSAALAITVTGTNDVIVIDEVKTTVSASTTDVERAFVEDVAAPTYTGTIAFVDVDLRDTHVVSSTSIAVSSDGRILPSTTRYGNFIIGGTDEAVNSATGEVGFFYLFDPASTNEIALGEVVTETYTVTINDLNGSTISRNIVITITGTNEAPIINVVGGDAVSVSVAETTNGNNITVGDTLTVTDTDRADFVDMSSVYVGATGTVAGLASAQALAGYLVVTPASVGADAVPASNNNVTYTFDAASTAFDYLADGESVTLTYRIIATDDSGAAMGNTDDQLVTVTINGTNDAPVVSVKPLDSALETVSETNAGLTLSDTLTVIDADLTDTVTLSSTATAVTATGPLGGLSPTQLQQFFSVATTAPLTSPLAADPGAGSTGNITWSFNSGSTSFDYLADGESLQLVYTVTATDDSGVLGNSGSQTVTINITGTNDAPVLTAPTAIAFMDTAADDTFANVAGSLVATDVDATDLLSYSIVGGTTLAMPTTVGAVAYDTSSTNTFGTLYLASANGKYVFVANDTAIEGLTANATTSFALKVTDDSGVATNNSATQLLTINLTGANDTPDANPDTNLPPTANAVVEAGVIAGDATATGNVLANDTDRDLPAQALRVLTPVVAQPLGNATNGAAVRTTLNVVVGDQLTFTYNFSTGDSGNTTYKDFGFFSVSSGSTNSVVVLESTLTDVAGSGNYTYTFGASGTFTVGVGTANVQDTSVNPTIIVSGLALNGTAIAASAVSSIGSVAVNGSTFTASAVGSTTESQIETFLAIDQGDLDALVDLVPAPAVTISGVYGSVTIAQNGAYTYTLDNTDLDTQALTQGQTVVDTFNYTVKDSAGATDSSTLAITVIGTNDAPVAVADTNAGDAVVEAGAPIVSTFVSTTAVTIPDLTTVASTITVAGFTGSVADLNLGINLNHSFVGDLVISLTHNDVTVIVANGADAGSNDFTIRLDDEAGRSVQTLPVSGGLTVAGTFIPNGALAAFDGMDPNGVWTLTIQDAFGEDSGVLNGWQLDFSKAVSTADSSAAGNVLSNDADVDSAPATLHVTAVAGLNTNVAMAVLGTYGSVTINADGSYSYVLDDMKPATIALTAGQTMLDTFSYTVTDDFNATSTNTLTISVTGTNDAPSVREVSINDAGLVTFIAGDADTVGNLSVLLDAAPSAQPAFGAVVQGVPVSVTLTEQARVTTGQLVISDGSATGDIAGITLGTAGDDVLEAPTPGGAPFAVYGFGGNDSFASGAGNDLFVGGAGSDTVTSYNLSTDGQDRFNLGLEAGDVVNVSTAAAVQASTGTTQIRLSFTSAEVGNGNTSDSTTGTLANQDGGLAVRIQAETTAGLTSGSTGRADDEGVTFLTSAGTTFEVQDLVSGAVRGQLFNRVVLGTNGDDIDNGTAGNDYVNGGMGNDVFDGGTGNDFLVGGAGTDALTGGAGNDSFIGGAGNDTITGGLDVDTVVAYNLATDGSDEINLGTETVTSAALNDVVNVTSTGAAQIRVTFTSANVGNGTGTGTASDTANTVNLSAEDALGDLTGSAGYADDEGITFVAATGTTFDVRDISGTARGDMFSQVVLGSSGADGFDFAAIPAAAGVNYYVNAGAGNDSVTGNTGNDFLVGGGGDDTLIGNDGNDSFLGGAGDDSVTGGSGNDVFNVTAGSDTITDLATGDELKVSASATAVATNVAAFAATAGTTNAGTAILNAANTGATITLADAVGPNGYTVNGGLLSDSITGSALADSLSGSAGNDSFVGGAGNDTITGGLDVDTVVAYNLATDGSDEINLGTETVTSAALNDVANVTSTGATQIRVTFTSANVGNGTGAGMALDTANTVSLQAEGALDTLTGSVGYADDEGITFVAATGTTFDVRDISGTGRGDQFDRVVLGSIGADSFDFGAISAAAGVNYYVNAGMGNDSVTGNTGNDFLVGGGGDDTLVGGDGNDSFIGGAGVDVLQGGAGNERFVFNTAADLTADALVDGGADLDTLVVGNLNTGVSLVDTDFEDVLSVETLVLTGGNNTVTLGTEALGDGVTTAGIASVMFGSGNDLLTLTQSAVVTVTGGLGSDTVVGSNLIDTLSLSGVEVVMANDGNDSITFTGAAAATVDGGAGLDTVLLDNFVNALTATGVETITGGDNADTILVTGLAASTISGGAGNDNITGGGGADSIVAGEGFDVVRGGNGKDMIVISETVSVRDQLIVGDRESGRLTGFDVVKGFMLNSDTIDFGSSIMVANGFTDGVVSGQLAFDTDLAASLTAAAQLVENELHNQAGQQGGTAAFVYKGSTYVGEVTGNDGVETFTDLVQLEGVSASVGNMVKLIGVDGSSVALTLVPFVG